jgi:hypothetical protein
MNASARPDSLDVSLDRVAAGDPLDGVLAALAAEHREHQALVAAAAAVRSLPTPLDAAFRARLRGELVHHVDADRPRVRAISLAWRAVALALALAFVGTGGLVVASANSRPGEPLYGLQQGLADAWHSLGRWLTPASAPTAHPVPSAPPRRAGAQPTAHPTPELAARPPEDEPARAANAAAAIDRPRAARAGLAHTPVPRRTGARATSAAVAGGPAAAGVGAGVGANLGSQTATVPSPTQPSAGEGDDSGPRAMQTTPPSPGTETGTPTPEPATPTPTPPTAAPTSSATATSSPAPSDTPTATPTLVCPAGGITGRVTLPGGGPAAGADVLLLGEAGSQRELRTGPDGLFAACGAAPGRYVAMALLGQAPPDFLAGIYDANADGDPDEIGVPDTTTLITGVDITLAPVMAGPPACTTGSATLSGRVTLPGDVPAAGADVMVFSPADGLGIGEQTGADGSYSLQGLCAGTYFAYAFLDDGTRPWFGLYDPNDDGWEDPIQVEDAAGTLDGIDIRLR